MVKRALFRVFHSKRASRKQHGLRLLSTHRRKKVRKAADSDPKAKVGRGNAYKARVGGGAGRIGGWQAERQRLRTVLPPGPASKLDLSDWPSRNTEAFKQRPARIECLLKLFLRGLQVMTDFSGVDGPKEAMEQQILSMITSFGWDMTVEEVCQFTRACDIGADQRHILLAVAKGRG